MMCSTPGVQLTPANTRQEHLLRDIEARRRLLKRQMKPRSEPVHVDTHCLSSLDPETLRFQSP